MMRAVVVILLCASLTNCAQRHYHKKPVHHYHSTVTKHETKLRGHMLDAIKKSAKREQNPEFNP